MGGMPKVLELKEWFPNLPTTKISHQRAPATKHRHTIFRNIYIPKKWKLIIQIQSYMQCDKRNLCLLEILWFSI